MQYSAGRRSSSGSLAAASSTTSPITGARLSIGAGRASTRAAGGLSIGATRYSTPYSTTSPGRSTGPSAASRYSRFTSTKDSPTSNFRTSRYDSYYSNYSPSSVTKRSDIGENRYTSPASRTSGSDYLKVTAAPTSRETSLSKSWPSPARNLSIGIASRFDPSARSSSSTLAASIERRRHSPTVVGGSVPVLPSTSSTYLNSESRRGSADLSINRLLNKSPSASTLYSTVTRRYLVRGSTDGNFDAGRAESLYRPSARYGSAGTNRYLNSLSKSYDIDTNTTGVSSVRRSSILSTSSIGASSMSRTGSPSPSPASKSLWNRHYNSLTARWAEKTGGQLAAGKNQYSYNPISRRASNGSDIQSDGSIDAAKQSTNPCTKRRGDKEESDGYDSSSSSDQAEEKGGAESNQKSAKAKKAPATAGSGAHRRSKVKNSGGVGAAVNGAGTDSVQSGINTRREEKQPSSSDNETVQDSLDARIKARRKRLQKSKVMLQEHKEEGWHYRRTLQIEESKQRQQTSAASTISYSRNPAPVKKDQAKKYDTVTAKKDETLECNPPGSARPVSDNASGFRVQKVYLQPLKAAWRNDSTPANRTDQAGKQEDQSSQQSRNEQGVEEVNVGSRKSEEKIDSITVYRRSPMYKSSPNRALSNERTPPPPISQRQDFNYSRYVHSIAPKSISYENPTAALIEADQQQLLEDLPKGQNTKRQEAGTEETKMKEDGKGSGIKSNGCDDQNSIPLRTVPVRTQPPSVVVVAAVTPPTGRAVNKPSDASSTKPPSAVTPANSLNSVPTPFRRTSLSPGRKPIEGTTRMGLPQSRSIEKLADRSAEVKRRPPPLPPAISVDDDERKRRPSEPRKNVANLNYAVVNGDQQQQPTKNTTTPAVTVIPVVMVPAKSVPEKLTLVLTQTFSQPSASKDQISSRGFAANASKALWTREATPPATPTAQYKPMIEKERSAPARVQDHREMTPVKTLNEEKVEPVASLKVAEEIVRSQLVKHQRKESLKKESLADMYHLPSVDKEILHLLTLGEELNAPRNSLSNATNRAPSGNQSQQTTSKFVQSFRTAMPQKANPPLPGAAGCPEPRRSVNAGGSSSYQGSKESLNSYNVAPKPWCQTVQSQEGSSESLASSFATAPCNLNTKDSRDSSHLQKPYYPCPKPWSNKLSGKDRLSTSAEPLATLAECPNEASALMLQKPNLNQGKNTHSLELATRKVDEMLRLAKMKHKQQQRREKIILLQSQAQQPHNLTVITQCNTGAGERSKNAYPNPSRELDNVYEAIRLDYAEAQESRRRHQQNGSSISDNENVFMKPQLVSVASTVQLPSPRKAVSSDEAGGWQQRGAPTRKASMAKDRKSHETRAVHATNSQYDKSKMDYTKRWLEGDLKSLAQDTKPDLLQFGSASKMEFDQRSVGSASAEVAAITNKDRLKSMRAVPDLVPENQQCKPNLVKPAPMIPAKQPRINRNIGDSLAPNMVGAFAGPQVGQPGTKSSSFTGGIPALQNHVSAGRMAQHAPRYDVPSNCLLQPPKQQQQPMNLNSGGIQKAADQLRSSVESLPHSERSWTIPRNVCSHGHVRKHVDMFDKMSDNDSEVSFRSADNVAYRSALYKPSRRLSLTDHMSTFARRFESDEESNHSAGGTFYRRLQPPRQAHNDMHSDDEVRLAVLRRSNPNAPQYRRQFGYGQNMPTNGNGSTQSLPVTMPRQHFPPGGPFQAMAPNRGAPRLCNSFAQHQAPANAHGQEKQAPQQQGKVVPAPRLRGHNAAPSPAKQYWSSNSTLTDVEGACANRPRHTRTSNDNMQAVDNLVAELELHTDCSGSVISQRSTGSFPVDRYYYNSHYHQYSAPVDLDKSSSRSKLNAIPEQAEQQNPFDALHLAQQRLEEARRDLQQAPSGGIRRQLSKEKTASAAGKVAQSVSSKGYMKETVPAKPVPLDVFHSTRHPPHINPSNASLPRSLDGGEKRSFRDAHQRQEGNVQYRRNRSSVTNRPASFAAPTGGIIPSSCSSAFVPGGSSDRISNQRSNHKEEGNYDNVFIGCWRPSDSQPKGQEQVPSSPLNTQNTIKIGSVVLGRTNDQSILPKIDKQQSQQPARNPLKNFLQLFNKGSNGNNDKISDDDRCDQRQLQHSYHQETSPNSSYKAPSTFSLNVRTSAEPQQNQWTSASMTSSMVAADGNVHKSSSSNDAYSLKSNMTPEEKRQLEELLSSFHDAANANQKKDGEKDGRVEAEGTGAHEGAKQARGNQTKSSEKSTNNHEHRSHSKFRLGLPFWKRA